ncbi:IDEAL domain-containing protein [Caldibacillus lycopersici]|uniref:IDEAL domain-containing protein n=1 Tax=Perspicuibacillus lycopersici TaxID=1325689 RepID=A0AAE3ISB1_9BACI|nr:IDEAL domain-containing protein [Perspicuibacillus lycopersici]MCU9612486.1 IDEAL domain-containing protein [Perspicuibacillus lycopersici]
MKNENSYAELTKAYALAHQQRKEKFVQSIYIDILLHESLLKEKQKKLKRKIDEAIDCNDRETFHLLAEELKNIEKELNA